MIETLKPIIDMRAVEYRWMEAGPNDAHGYISTIERVVHRIEIRREGDIEWTAVPLIEKQGRPDWSRI